MDEFANLLNTKDLSPRHVYSADDTALVWRYTPKNTLTSPGAESPSGFKSSSGSVTVLCYPNPARSHRCKLFVIGKSLHRAPLKRLILYWIGLKNVCFWG